MAAFGSTASSFCTWWSKVRTCESGVRRSWATASLALLASRSSRSTSSTMPLTMPANRSSSSRWPAIGMRTLRSPATMRWLASCRSRRRRSGPRLRRTALARPSPRDQRPAPDQAIQDDPAHIPDLADVAPDHQDLAPGQPPGERPGAERETLTARDLPDRAVDHQGRGRSGHASGYGLAIARKQTVGVQLARAALATHGCGQRCGIDAGQHRRLAGHDHVHPSGSGSRPCANRPVRAAARRPPRRPRRTASPAGRSWCARAQGSASKR